MISHKLILLAAGRGSRLGNRTQDIPKCLNTYNNKPLIQHIIDSASAFENINEIVVIGGYKVDLLRQFNCKILENNNWENTGPFGTLSIASELLSNHPCIISYTDIYFSEDFLNESLNFDTDIYVPSNVNFLDSWENRNINILEDIETFNYEGDVLTEIGGKSNSLSNIKGQFAGIFKTKPNGWHQLFEVSKTVADKKLDITSLLSSAIKLGVKINTSQVSGYWKEFDLPEDFR